jgi:gamma-glutamyltranspeptidase/glutathione hydrolase
MPLGVVATGHRRVTDAASATLRAGGNAFDAAVAAAFAAAVAEPMFTSLAGGGFLLARTGAGEERLIDFFVDVPGRGAPRHEPRFTPVTVRFPSSEQVFHVGLGSVAVPGTLRGLLTVHRRLGRIPLREVIAPAISLARDGLEVTAHQAYVIDLLTPITTSSATGRELFAPAGRAPRQGERIHNSALADFLELLPSEGDRDFYDGSLARTIASEMSAGGGLLTESDMAAYQVIERKPLAIAYRGLRLLTNPPPSFGGSLVALSLQLLAAAGDEGASWGSAEHLRKLVAVMIEAERAREEGGAESAGESLEARSSRVRRAFRGTTHISVSDAEGAAASMSLSNGEGSGSFVPGTGIMLNNMLGEDDLHPEGFHSSPPGERVASMMSPSLLSDDTGVRLILGSGGSKRIRTALVQVISNVVDHAMNLRDAVEAPRLHWDGECVQLEPGFEPEAVRALSRGWAINEWSERNLYFGGVHAVGGEEAAGDPRREGAAGRVLDASSRDGTR